MVVAQIHNKYRDLGGEDIVVERERKLLEEAGHTVHQFFVSNSDLATQRKKLLMALRMTHNKISEKAVIEFLKTTKPDVVHVHNFLPVLSPSVFEACKKEDVPVVLTLHNFRLLCINGLLYRNNQPCEKCIDKPIATPGIKHGCYQDSAFISIFPTISNAVNSKNQVWQNKIDKVIFLSQFSKDVFDRSHIAFLPEQVVIKPNFVYDQGHSFDKKDFFLFVGRLSEEKGIKTIVEAFKQTGQHLVIAGDGPLREAIETSIIDYEAIRCIGFKNQEELRHLYLNAKALVFASKMYEGNPLVILESFSFGTPVIVPDFGNAGILIQDGYNGLKYILNSTLSLAETLVDFDKRDKEKLYKQAHDTFLEKYTPEKSLADLENIYEELKNM